MITLENRKMNSLRSKLTNTCGYAALIGDGTYLPSKTYLLVSKDGKDIIDTNSGITLKQSKDGLYRRVYIPDAKDSYPVHRLVAMAWLGVPPFYNRLVVNHIDSNKSNNHADNLEWSTKALNNSYAVSTGERQDARNTNIYTVYELDTKENRICVGPKHVSSVTGLRYELVDKLETVPIITTKGRFVILPGKEADFSEYEDLPIEYFEDYTKRCDRYSMNVKALNVLSGEERFYPRQIDASNDLGVPISSISQQCRYPGVANTPINGWFFSEVIDQGAPRKYLLKKGVITKRGVSNENKRIPILVTDLTTHVTERFDWIGDFCAKLNRIEGTDYSHKNIQRVLLDRNKKGKDLIWHNYKFKFLR